VAAGNPGSVEAATLVGDVYSKLHRYRQAYDAYSQVLAIDAAQPRPRMGRGVMAAALGRYSEARKLLEEAANSFPNNEQVRHNYARLLVGATLTRAPVTGRSV
jgi:Flp pilus assembly protein TadD